MNIFDLIGQITISILLLPLKAVKNVKPFLKAILNLEAKPAPKTPPPKAEGHPERLTTAEVRAEIKKRQEQFSLYPDLLTKFNRSAAAPQRTPSVSTGALSNQLPSARSLQEELKKDGWDRIARYDDPIKGTTIRLSNTSNNTAKDLNMSDFLKELRKHGFKV